MESLQRKGGDNQPSLKELQSSYYPLTVKLRAGTSLRLGPSLDSDLGTIERGKSLLVNICPFEEQKFENLIMVKSVKEGDPYYILVREATIDVAPVNKTIIEIKKGEARKKWEIVESGTVYEAILTILKYWDRINNFISTGKLYVGVSLQGNAEYIIGRYLGKIRNPEFRKNFYEE